MAITLNLAGVKTGFDPVPPGNYDVTVVKAEETLAKSSGKPMIAMQYRISEPEEHEGRLLFDNFSLQSQALWKLKGFLQALEWAGIDEDGLELDPAELIGVSLTVAVIQEPGQNQGEMRNTVKGYGGGGGGAELGEDVDIDFEGTEY